MKKNIRAILFDFGETLMTFGKVDTLSLYRHGAKLSYDFLQSQGQTHSSFTYYCWRSLISLRLRCWWATITGNDFDSLEILKRLGRNNRIKLTDQQWLSYAWLWYQPLAEIAKVEKDIIDTLTKLKDSGLKLGIISNTFVNKSSLEKHLKQFGILDFFEPRLYSYEFNFRKPDPRIFTTAAERLAMPLENIAYVGDRINNDITPAIKLGMTAVLKTAYTNDGLKTPKNAHKINLLSELPAIIEKINTKSMNRV